MSASPGSDSAPTPNWPRMRPRFIVELPADAELVMESLREGLERNAKVVEGTLSPRHGVLTMPESQRRFWSTQLGITVEDGRRNAQGEAVPTRVLGIFSPHPELWTGFVFAIGTLAGIAIFFTMYSIVQLSMGWPPWALIVSLVALLLGALVYTSTLVGQGLAADEMYRLRSHVDECLARARERASREPKTSRDSASL